MLQKGGDSAKRKWGEIERGMRGKMIKRKGKQKGKKIREGENETNRKENNS